MNCRDLELLYEKAKDSYKDRKFLYIFPRTGNTYSAVNYYATNCELNSFLKLFDIWGSHGEHKISEDKNHQEVWFEVDEEFYLLAKHSKTFQRAIEKLGVTIVFEYPLYRPISQVSNTWKSAVEDYLKIGKAWNEQYIYRDEDDE